jgi:ketosteroid isomerase-like protein
MNFARLLLASLMILIGDVAAAHPPGRQLTAEETAIARQVLSARETIRTLVEAKDTKGLTALYTDDFTHTHGSGKVDARDNRIVAMLSGDPVIELAPVDELLVRIHGPTTAIVSGRSPVKSLADGRTYDFRWIQVFVKIGDGWRIAASQATRLPPPPN